VPLRYHYVVTGHGPPPIGGHCGHAHATREEAQGCVRRGRSHIERVPVVETPATPGWGCALLVALAIGFVWGVLQT
jgi:hypothetical protein